MFAGMTIARYRFDLEAVDMLSLPAFQASTFRGGFGHAFKKMVCAQPNWGVCTPCALGNRCPYGYVFETTAPPDGTELRNLHEVTPPFVIEAPAGARQQYQPGDRLGFDLVLIGRGCDYLPYFLLAFGELGRMGIGKPAGRYTLQRVRAVHPLTGATQLVFDGVEVTAGTPLAIGYDEVASWAESLPADELNVRFLTPTRIKYQGQLISSPSFHVLFRALLRRLGMLLDIHCGQRWQGDARALIAQAEAVETLHANTRWLDWERFSGRQQQRVPLGGFVGDVIYGGDLHAFRAALALGALVHIGKGTVFGNGRYLVESEGIGER